MQARPRRTLEAIFENPERSNIPWQDIEALFIALGAEVSEGRGSRVRVALHNVRAVFHRPHPHKETEKGAVTSVRRFLQDAGSTMMTYKGYVGKVEFDDEAGIFYGEVINLRDVITFQGTTVQELRQAFQDSVDDYLEFCAQRGEEAEKPFSGKFVVRVSPDIHRELFAKARLADKSLNSLVSEVLQASVEKELPQGRTHETARARPLAMRDAEAATASYQLMTHPLVTQLRFARNEFVRCLDGVSEEDGVKRLFPMNCISWIVGHLANQEHAYWVYLAQGKVVAPELRQLVGFGQPASTPPLAEMWAKWREVTAEADVYLDTLAAETLLTRFTWRGEPMDETVGSLLLRNIYHYWFHTGEAHAIRQMLGHPDLPQFVGGFGEAVYRPENR